MERVPELTQEELSQICESFAENAFAVASRREAGGDVEQIVSEASVQILSDASEGKVHPKIAFRLIAAINLGAHGRGSARDIASLVYSDCLDAKWLYD